MVTSAARVPFGDAEKGKKQHQRSLLYTTHLSTSCYKEREERERESRQALTECLAFLTARSSSTSSSSTYKLMALA